MRLGSSYLLVRTLTFRLPIIQRSLLYQTQEQSYSTIYNTFISLSPLLMQTPGIILKYLKCNKSGLHEFQNLNMVCLEKTCLQNSICCCACIESQHKKHKNKPLKMVMSEVKNQASSFKHQKINIDIMLDIVKGYQQASFELFLKYKSEILSNLENIELTLQGYYNHTIDQILLKNSDSNLMIEEALERAAAPKNSEELKITIKKLIAALSEEKTNGRDLTEEELKQSLHESSDSIKRSINLAMDEVNQKLSKYQKSIGDLINSTSIWHEPYRFSQKLKHPDIKLISDNMVKSINTAGYKFALMEPSVGKASKKTFTFHINESNSNWLGIGFCYKKVVESKKFSFVFGSLGHGGYLISSNGGSWSHSKAQHNNNLKAIKFTKGDTVKATIDQEQLKIIFETKQNQKYELPYIPIENDELHPCVLFYYTNDEVQYFINGKK